jgi:rhamnose utilization protein RhaD (predicted bifunctional aldolase and dehydrogenase)/NAD(P)-dependent dehydrogenase (short-subunit alcohol dehydrogenase family)
MVSTWGAGAPATAAALSEIVRVSRLLGSDPSLVLHGGGNTSVKATWSDITGQEIEALFVKGSGWDLATIEAPGFAPLPIARLHALLALESLSDAEMMRELSAARLDPGAPQPSVEALLHAFLPHRFVLHSHADLVLTITNLDDGERRARELWGDALVHVPYVMPGFDLAREVQRHWNEQAHAGTVGILLRNHGLFTFADDADTAHRRHLELIAMAARHVEAMPAAQRQAAAPEAPCRCAVDIAELRRLMSLAAGRPLIAQRDTAPEVMAFVARPDLADLAGRGPVTPDHVIRTKRVPLVGRDVDGYVAGYRDWFERHAPTSRTPVTMLDPAPRVLLDPEIGMLAIGVQAKDARIADDIYRHTIGVATICEDRMGGWRPLPDRDLFDVEYWELEQAKLGLAGAPPPLAGRIAVVTGAASGIGRACAAALLGRGAAVVGLDRAESVTAAFPGPSWLGVRVDVTDAAAVGDAIEAGVERFGGVDIAVLAAGVFGAGAAIAALDASVWSSVLGVNLDAVATSMRLLHPFLARSPVGGRVVLVGSKNVAAPGPGAAAYSASKAAATQLARVAALEWASDGIRVNTVHPDAVFDTGLWSPELLAERAARYGLTVEQYKRRNLLATEVTSARVGAVVVDLCGDSFLATTGAQIPIDGGNDRTV